MHPRVDRNLILLAAALLLVVLLAVASRRAQASGQGGLGAAVVATVVSPLERVFAGIARGVGGVRDEMREIRRLHTDNQRLRGQVQRLSQRVNELQEERIENTRLREMLRFRETLPNRGADARAATVIGMKPTNWFNSVIIDIGSEQGVREKQMVITPRGLVGQVRLVTPKTASVLLITDLNSGVGGRIQRTGWNGVVKGTAGPLLEMVFLPREADVRQGDLVVTSGMGSVFQTRGIAIGTVESVHLDEHTSVKTAVVRPAADFRRLQEVFVLSR